ncbi:MAG: hypothetical protein OTJ98_00900 [Dehalococcoidia bacterium]|nr:hypothetical protein [Dehalococcoidia bacterium]
MACDGGIVERVQELLVGHAWVSERLMFDGLALSAMKGLLYVVSEAPDLDGWVVPNLEYAPFLPAK